MVRLSLPVAKYSHATGVVNGSIPWTHLTAVDIYVLVNWDDGEVQDRPLSMKIVHGTSTLEYVDLASYISEAIHARVGAEQVGVAANIEQLPIFGITKESLLALRYRLNNGQARRIQLRMHSYAECQQIVSVFKGRGMEFQEQRPHTARPGTTTSLPLTAYSDGQATGVPTTSPFFPDPKGSIAKSSFHLSNVEAGNLSRRLSTVQPYRSSIASYQSPAFEIGKHQHHSHESVPRSFSSFQMGNMEAIRPATEEHEKKSGATRETGSTSRTWSAAHNSSSSASELWRLAPASSDSVQARPRTAMLVTSTVTALPEVQVDPCRPPGLHSGDSGTGSRPGSAALALPPLKRPSMVKDRIILPSSDRPRSSVKANSSVRPSPVLPQTNLPYIPVDAFDRSSDAKDPGARTQAQGCDISTASMADIKRKWTPGDIFEKPAGSDELPEQSSNAKVPRMSSLQGTVPQNRPPPRSAKSVRPNNCAAEPPPPASGVGNINFGQAPENVQLSHEFAVDDSLEQYAAQEPVDRLAILDQFMIENLENPSFATVCEDIENCWRRIALGL